MTLSQLELQRTYEAAVDLHRQGRLDAALELYDAVVCVAPNFAAAHNNRGHALTALGRPSEALASFEAAIRLRLDYAEAFNNRGNALRNLARPAEALASYETAIALKPGLAEAHSNRGNALFDLGRTEEALAAYDSALALAPDAALALRNRGAALYRLNRPREAIASYDQAIRIEPGDAEARYQQSLALLLSGDFEAGWRAYEWRKRRPGQRSSAPSGAAWLGEGDIPQSVVLVYEEQGLGDTLQFCRFVAALRSRCRNVVLQVRPELTSLLSTSLGVACVTPEGDALPAFDVHCALMSLPLALGVEPTRFAADGPYLRAEPERSARWRAELGPPRRPRVGLVWGGAPHHPDDRNRSIPLQRLAPLLSADFDWVCLQQSLTPAEADSLTSMDPVFTPPQALADFSDTAALVDNLDLVISVDTSVAHLVGAMGKPVWILLPFGPDWRWGVSGESTPWYPSARLFRQPAPNDWESVVVAVRSELARMRAPAVR